MWTDKLQRVMHKLEDGAKEEGQAKRAHHGGEDGQRLLGFSCCLYVHCVVERLTVGMRVSFPVGQ